MYLPSHPTLIEDLQTNNTLMSSSTFSYLRVVGEESEFAGVAAEDMMVVLKVQTMLQLKPETLTLNNSGMSGVLEVQYLLIVFLIIALKYRPDGESCLHLPLSFSPHPSYLVSDSPLDSPARRCLYSSHSADTHNNFVSSYLPPEAPHLQIYLDTVEFVRSKETSHIFSSPRIKLDINILHQRAPHML
ncbi:hypothetical protein BDR07DRAFT_1380600 [Suillus spraguei]|nr:hypothetical protein BDR07DRAFT_1380600 [Suillus spraguei]